jgi:hypothetical protein
MKKLFMFLAVSAGLPLSIALASRASANEKIKRKVDLIEQSLTDSGYRVRWIIISERRSKFINSLLPNSVKNSQHLIGNAIDVHVFDINGDGTFNKKDVDIVKKHNRLVEKAHPELKGAFGTYLNTLTSYHTIHFDTRGRSVEYNK